MIEIGPIGPNVSDTFSKRLFWIGADAIAAPPLSPESTKFKAERFKI